MTLSVLLERNGDFERASSIFYTIEVNRYVENLAYR